MYFPGKAKDQWPAVSIPAITAAAQPKNTRANAGKPGNDFLNACYFHDGAIFF